MFKCKGEPNYRSEKLEEERRMKKSGEARYYRELEIIPHKKYIYGGNHWATENMLILPPWQIVIYAKTNVYMK